MNDKLRNNIRIQIEDLEIISITDTMLELPAPKMFPLMTDAEWAKLYEDYPNAFNKLDTWSGRISCNFIKAQGKLILIDTGLGPSSTAFAKALNLQSGALPVQMKKEGIRPEDVDVVFLTHLHADHVGWNTTADTQQPIFPNAQYIASETDWDFCQWRLRNEPEKAGYINENIMPLVRQQLIKFIDGEVALVKGVKAFPSPGHTPGHMSIRTETKNGHLVWLLGDVVAHPLQITNTDHHYVFDKDSEMASRTRFKVLAQIEREGGLTTACHFPYPGFGEITRRNNNRQWKPISLF